MTENEIKELKEDNEKRKVNVKMWGDCGLPRLLCALNPIPYLTKHVQSAGLRLVSDLGKVLGKRHRVSLRIASDLRVGLISPAQTFIHSSGIDVAVFCHFLASVLLLKDSLNHKEAILSRIYKGQEMTDQLPLALSIFCL